MKIKLSLIIPLGLPPVNRVDTIEFCAGEWQIEGSALGDANGNNVRVVGIWRNWSQEDKLGGHF